MGKLIHRVGKGRPRQVKRGADMSMLTEVPPAPDYFSEDARRFWVQACGVLVARNDLSVADLGVVETYCQAVVDFRRHTQVLEKEGFTRVNSNGNVVQHPLVYIRKGTEQQINLAAAALGFTPRGRAVMVNYGEVPADEEDPELKDVSGF